MERKNKKIKKWINEIETNISAIVFIFLTILLNLQVVTRYVFHKSATWTEEISIILFVALVYFAMSSAVTERKHLRIDFVVEMLPFKFKKILMIISNLFFLGFCIYIIFPMQKIIVNFDTIHAVTSILRIPRSYLYSIISVAMIFCVIRIIQDSIRLFKETESKLGTSKALIDLCSFETNTEAESNPEACVQQHVELNSNRKGDNKK